MCERENRWEYAWERERETETHRERGRERKRENAVNIDFTKKLYEHKNADSLLNKKWIYLRTNASNNSPSGCE